MTIPVWPASLPQRILRDGYSEPLPDGRLFTKPSAGPPKSRRRYSKAAVPITATIVVDYASKARLERFWVEELDWGSLPFIMPDQTHDGVPIFTSAGVPLLTSAGVPILVTAYWLVMFQENSAPKFDPLGVQFRAAFTLLKLP
ncbi:hypothetical protein [Methylosinus sp. LW4]|uniref:hypothetical protein n=1 Tax=Methylosinus sp. LW4 TaxID=136993 RepID=UPI000477C169|nr:hypothetical protein [Methylosinus sp. LW4]